MKRVLVVVGLIGLVLLCVAVLTIWKPQQTLWQVVWQVVLVVVGAWLGTALGSDAAQDVIDGKTGPAVRGLFDQAGRLRQAVLQADEHANRCRVDSENGVLQDSHQCADAFDVIGTQLRSEIFATGTAIENWRDLSKRIYAAELARFRERSDEQADGSTGQ